MVYLRGVNEQNGEESGKVGNSMCVLYFWGKNNVGISGKGEQRKTVTVEYTDKTHEMRIIIIIINETVLYVGKTKTVRTKLFRSRSYSRGNEM